MKHLPNLLKQESSSAATLVHVLLRMYYDERQSHEAARPQIAKQLMPLVYLNSLRTTSLIMLFRLGLGVLQDYNKLRADTQVKNIAAWTPVVAEILDGFCRFDDKAVSHTAVESLIFFFMLLHAQFARYLPAIYPLATELLSRDMAPEIRQGLKMFFVRVGFTQGFLDGN